MHIDRETYNYSQVRGLLSTHLPTLDGIRGLAVIIVAFHTVGAKGIGEKESVILKIYSLVSYVGWIGVELFFVLSGFLITGVLLDGKGKKHQLKKFYIRRGLRIFPLYYTFLILIFVLLPLIGMVPVWLKNTQHHEAWYWVYLINWVQPFYDNIELGHFWSLAIEEQFYLLWPLLVIWVNRKTLVSVCIGLIISAMFARLVFILYLPEVGAKIAYTFTFARYDALAVGALVAIIYRDKAWFEYANERVLKFTVIILMAIVFLTVVNRTFAPAAGFGGFLNQTLVAFLCGLAIFISITSNINRSSSSYKLLSSKILTKFGKYSYAIYIIHVPIKFIWFPQYALDPMGFDGLLKVLVMIFNFACVLLISTALAYISWCVIEQPCLRQKRHFS